MPEEGHLKSDGEIMEILAAYDLTGSVRSAAVLVGCSHHTVAAHVAALTPERARAIGAAARARILAEHTYARRGAQVDALLRETAGRKRAGQAA